MAAPMLRFACSYVAEKIQTACCGRGGEKEVKGVRERECKLAGGKVVTDTPLKSDQYGTPTQNGANYCTRTSGGG